MTLQEFKEKFQPVPKIENPEGLSFIDGYLQETKGEIKQYVPGTLNGFMWTLVDYSDEEHDFALIPGFHHMFNSTELVQGKSSIIGWVKCNIQWKESEKNLFVEL